MSTEPTVDEVRELLKHVEHVHPGHSTDVIVVDRNIVARLCRHFLASQQPLTAGEFAGLALADLKQVAEDYKRAGTWNGKAFTECAIARISEVARAHNITIVGPTNDRS